MAQLPQKLPYDLMLTAWAKLLNPMLDNAIMQGTALDPITLNAGYEKGIPIKINRTQQGWIITDQLSNANVWRTRPFNASTLYLQASADTTITIWVY
jgi:hypothetical protein